MSNITYSAQICSKKQADVTLKHKISKLYIPFDLFYNEQISHEYITHIHSTSNIEVYIVLPEILREKDSKYLESLAEFLLLGKADGVLTKNLEEIGFIYSLEERLNEQYISIQGTQTAYTPLIIEGDYNLYCWNKHSLEFLSKYCSKLTSSLELSIHEIKELEDRSLIIPIYGKAPLMISANCIRKTCGECINGNSFVFDRKINDRKNKSQIIEINCIHCFNKLYNNVPTSYHKQVYDLIKAGFEDFRLDFTDESVEDIDAILTYYIDEKRSGSFPINEYTTGHILKGAI